MAKPKREPWLNRIPELLKQSDIPNRRQLALRVAEELEKISPGSTFSVAYMFEIYDQQACPSYNVVKAIASVFGCSVEELDK